MSCHLFVRLRPGSWAFRLMPGSRQMLKCPLSSVDESSFLFALDITTTATNIQVHHRLISFVISLVSVFITNPSRDQTRDHLLYILFCATYVHIMMPTRSFGRFQAMLVPLAVSFFTVILADVRLDPVPDGWYSAYTKYPDYCSTSAMMQNRKIPMLQDDSRLGETRLVHATAVIRHGARTPTRGEYTCWDKYWDDPLTGVWNCSLTTQMSPPTPMHVEKEEGYDGVGSSDVVALFEKKYDALLDKEDGLSNSLFGTCQVGQLLLQGYEQEIANGQHLREAYCYDSSGYTHDQEMRLVDLNAQGMRPWEEPQIYFRSDDDQRTLLSGQALIRGMFQIEMDRASKHGSYPNIPVHVADRDRDVIGVNERICPRLTELRDRVHKSSTFKAFNQSSEAKHLRNFMLKDLKAPTEIEIMDCLMTTVCTDRPLPDAFDYEGESDIFDRMVLFQSQRYNMHLLANGAEYSKLAMAPVWAEIMDKINPVLNDKHDALTRLSIFSGHDDTIAPLLASIGMWNDTQWPPYASMVIIEIHEIIDGQSDTSIYESQFAFRMIHDGEVITHKMDGCLDDAELCDIKVFLDKVSPIAMRKRDCGTSKGIFTSWTQSGGGHLSGPWYTFCMILIGVACGVAGTFYYLTGSFPWTSMRARRTHTASNGSLGGPNIAPMRYTDEPYSDEPYPDESANEKEGITLMN